MVLDNKGKIKCCINIIFCLFTSTRCNFHSFARIQLSVTELQSSNSSDSYGMQHLLVKTKLIGQNGKNITLLKTGATASSLRRRRAEPGAEGVKLTGIFDAYFCLVLEEIKVAFFYPFNLTFTSIT